MIRAKRLRRAKHLRPAPRLWLPGMPVPEAPHVPAIVDHVAWRLIRSAEGRT